MNKATSETISNRVQTNSADTTEDLQMSQVISIFQGRVQECPLFRDHPKVLSNGVVSYMTAIFT